MLPSVHNAQQSAHLRFLYAYANSRLRLEPDKSQHFVKFCRRYYKTVTLNPGCHARAINSISFDQSIKRWFFYLLAVISTVFLYVLCVYS